MKKTTFLIVFFLLFAFTKSNAQGLVINEIDYDQPGTDTAEFVELYNSSANPIDLNIYALVLVNGNAGGAVPYDTIILPNQTLAPGGFFVICGNGGYVPNCDMQLPVRSNIVQNGAPDAMALVDMLSASIVDAVSYEGSVPAPFVEVMGVPIANSDTVLQPFLGIGRFPDGADLNDDSLDFNRYCITPGTANVNTTSGCPQPNSVESIIARPHMIIFPNPAADNVSLIGVPTTYSNWEVNISDITGKTTLE